MAVITDIIRRHTDLNQQESDHIRRLIALWGPLADLSFADLLLVAPAVGVHLGHLVCLGQIRPTTAPTLHVDDFFGRFLPCEEQTLAMAALESGQIEYSPRALDDGSDTPGITDADDVGPMAIPVVFDRRVVAVLVRQSAVSTQRTLGDLEMAYLGVFERLAEMIVDGVFPFRSDVEEGEEAPRVGDGVLVLDSRLKASYASPNAVSAFHRLGFHGSILGKTLTELGFKSEVSRSLQVLKVPIVDEIERGRSVTILARILPLLAGGELGGVLVLLRDVSEMRRRERLLLSKDATIREIHHRVKNNLQTVSSLLRIQARRVVAEEAKTALRDAERRIAATAAVHDLLARDGGDDVEFDVVVGEILKKAKDVTGSPVRFHMVGKGPILPTAKASSLALVVNELVLNAAEHGFPPGTKTEGSVTVELTHSATELNVRVDDDGVGLPQGFDSETSAGLGLTIIKTLVTQDLGGELTIRRATESAAGTVAQLTVGLQDPSSG